MSASKQQDSENHEPVSEVEHDSTVKNVDSTTRSAQPGPAVVVVVPRSTPAAEADTGKRSNAAGHRGQLPTGITSHTNAEEAVAGLDLPIPAIPETLVFRKNPDEDDFGYKALVEAMTSPAVYGYFRYALRTTAFVAFPLYTLGSHPNTQTRLGVPQLLISGVISFSLSKASLGEHAGMHTWVWHSIGYMLIFGTIAACLHVYDHIPAWYGYVGAGIFCASLCSHSSIRRFLYILFFVFMMMLRFEQYNFGVVKPNSAAWFAADMLIGSLLGVAATLFPYPVLVKTTLDGVITKLFGGLGKMLLGMETYVASRDVCAAEAFFADYGPLEKLEAGLAHMPPLLWFANWEPLEFPLRNPIRRLKLALLRRLIALTYAAFECGRTIVRLKKELARRKDIEKLRDARRERCGAATRTQQPGPSSGKEDESAKAPRAGAGEDAGSARAAVGEEEERDLLAQNTHDYVIDFVKTMAQCLALLGSTESKPAALLKAVPFATLVEKETLMRRNFRMEILQVMHLQRTRVARQSEGEEKGAEQGPSRDATTPAVEEAGKDAAAAGTKWTRHLSPAEHRLVLAYEEVIDNLDILLSLQRVFFRMLLGMIASELVAFEETMKAYKPAKSLCCRLVDFFLVEPWNGFWTAVWEQLTFATPQHVRTVKDAVKMACAFLTACAFNYEIWIPQGGMYFFGVTTVLGMPVEEETITTMVCRMMGNTMGCALGYLAANNTHSYAELIATTMCFTFLCRVASHHPMFGPGFSYAGVITLAMAASGDVPLEVLSRIVAGIYCALGYTLCCMLIFPTNPVKILWGYRVKLSKAFSDLLDDVAATAQLPLDNPDTDLVCNQLCSRMNVQVKLVKRMLDMCAKWTPFGANYPMIRGLAKFPGAASASIHHCQTRLVANFELLVFNMQLLRRRREQPVNSVVARTLLGPLSALLDELAGAVRLLCQDYIDSLHRSRQFSYPVLLIHVSYLARMRLRLNSIMYESYVFLSDISRGLSEGMTVEDYDAIRAEQQQRRMNGSSLAALGAPATEMRAAGGANTAGSEHNTSNLVEVKVDGEGDAGVGKPTANAPLQQQREEQSEAVGNQIDDPLTNPQDYVDVNTSFADRFLLRQALANALASSRENAEDGSPNNVNGSIFSNGAASVSFARRAFKFQAPLQEEHGEPGGAFPMAPEDPHRRLHQQLKKEQERQQQQQQLEDKRTGVDQCASGIQVDMVEESREGVAYEAVPPRREGSKLGRAVSSLVKDPQRIDPPLLPAYQGPNFSYHEDALESPVDTDFMALVAILSSCDGIIAEFQRMAPGVNEISGYQRQLHETTSCLEAIDTVSAKLLARRKEVYERYHYPSPSGPADTQGPLNAQADVWRDWRF